MIENWEQYKDLEYYPDRVCKCGCGGRIKVKPHHKYQGIPEYIEYHNLLTEANRRKINESRKSKPAWNKLPIEVRICKNPSCDITFEVSIHSTKRYCSMKCSRKCQKRSKHCEETKQKIQRSMITYWKSIETSSDYPREFNEELKTLIRERDDNTCQLCGRTKEEEGRNLCVHHIDYNKQNCDPKNLVTLCGGCNPRVNYHRKNWAFELLFDKLFEGEITDEETILAFSGVL